jgi:cytochrome c biogenesis protein ResB
VQQRALTTSAIPGAAPVPGAWLARLASLRLTLAAIAALGAGVLGSYTGALEGTWGLSAPLGVLAVNLAAAVLTNAAFRRQAALLVFHFALLAVVLLAAAGRLTYLKGRLELSTGETFSGELSQSERGPWHASRLASAAFTNEGFTIGYSAGVRRDETRNAVSWTDAAGRARRATIGDQQPLVLAGYRFYTSSNKGFAPVFAWQPKGGAPRVGTIHLPAYPVHEYRQALDWTLPGTDVGVWTMLAFDDVLLDPDRPSQFRLPERHTIVVRIGEDRRVLAPGGRVELAQGVLVYQGLTTWMGYTVFYDWTLPWLLAACLVAAAALAAHFWAKFAQQPWDA